MANYTGYTVSYDGSTNTITAIFTYSGSAPTPSPITAVLLNDSPITTYTAVPSGSTLTLTIPGPSMGNILQGKLEVDFTDPNDSITTIIPLGVTYTKSGFGAAAASITLTAPPTGNGMLHVGIYSSASPGAATITPIPSSGTKDPINVNTYTAFIDDYKSFDPAVYPDGLTRLAKLIVSSISTDSAFPSSNYTISSSGATVTLMNDSGVPRLFIYIFDDTLLKFKGTNYNSVVTANGVLPRTPV